MSVPEINSVKPDTGSTRGGDLVRILATNTSDRVKVKFGENDTAIFSVRTDVGKTIIDLKIPPHQAGKVDVTIFNLDANGSVIQGEQATLAGAFTYKRQELLVESDLTRVVRKILQEMKRQILVNTNITVSVDYAVTNIDGLDVIPVASLPAVILSGPDLRENRFYSSNEAHEDIVPGTSGPEIKRRSPAYTVDLSFKLTVVSDRTVQLLNIMAAIGTFLNRNCFLEIDRGNENGTIRYEMSPDGDFRTHLYGEDDIRSFTCGFVVHGFDIDEGFHTSISKTVLHEELETLPIMEI